MNIIRKAMLESDGISIPPFGCHSLGGIDNRANNFGNNW